jgi:hypothetical protein
VNDQDIARTLEKSVKPKWKIKINEIKITIEEENKTFIEPRPLNHAPLPC